MATTNSAERQYDIGEFARKYELTPEDACRIIDYAEGSRERADREATELTTNRYRHEGAA